VRDAFFASPLFPRLLNPDAVKNTIARGVESGLLAYVGKISSGEYQPLHFGGNLNAQDVEISEDMFIVSRETAESYKKLAEKPPILTSLIISPTNVQVQPGKKQAFVFKGLDQHGQNISTGAIEWNASGGTIDQDGVFSAAQDEGSFVVSGTVGSIRGSASVIIAKEGSAPTAILKPTPTPGVLRWTGEIPPQKWMNFYTKVLSKFASGQGLKLLLEFEVAPEGGISSQKVEETKVALAELGLTCDLETR